MPGDDTDDLGECEGEYLQCRSGQGRDVRFVARILPSTWTTRSGSGGCRPLALRESQYVLVAAFQGFVHPQTRELVGYVDAGYLVGQRGFERTQLVAEVVVDHALVHTRRCGNAVHARTRVSPAGELVDGGVEDLASGPVGVPGHVESNQLVTQESP